MRRAGSTPASKPMERDGSPSYLAHDRRRMICEFEAPDAESVRVSIVRRMWPSCGYGRPRCIG